MKVKMKMTKYFRLGYIPELFFVTAAYETFSDSTRYMLDDSGQPNWYNIKLERPVSLIKQKKKDCSIYLVEILKKNIQVSIRRK